MYNSSHLYTIRHKRSTISLLWFRPFHQIYYEEFKPKIGCRQISSANHKSANLQTIFVFRSADSGKCGKYICKCCNLRICNLRTIYLLRFADFIIFCELKTSANTSFVSLSLKCFHLIKFKDYIWLLGKFWDRVILVANQWGSACFFPWKFADLRFADWNTKGVCPCGFVICG